MGRPHILADQRAEVPLPSGLMSSWVTSLSPGKAFIQFAGSLRKENTLSTGAWILMLQITFLVIFHLLFGKRRGALHLSLQCSPWGRAETGEKVPVCS
jgi:hypothetical protein